MRVYTGPRSFDVVDEIFNAVTGVSAAFIVSPMDGLIAVAPGSAETWLWNNCCEGILGGVTSGANVDAARHRAQQLGPGKNVVTVIVDTGLRYLNGGLFG